MANEIKGLNQQEFTLVMEAVIGGLLENPSTSKETHQQVVTLVNKPATVYDVANITKTVVDYAINSVLLQLKPALESSMSSVAILEDALVTAGAITDDDITKAVDSYRKHLEAQLEASKDAPQAPEPPAKEVDSKGMTVVRNESEATLEIKG